MPNGKPNILVIWGDDIGITNLSCYSDGLMGYRTPNIDRIAAEGMRFTDSYGEQSCTAGRSSFITGQSVFRTGLSKVGMPGADVGLQAEDVTIAELLKPHGYATGQFGKNHLGDLNKFLPTAHGFDEFFGNLYHLNAEEEPELPNWPPVKDFPTFNERFRPRGVLHSWATDKDDKTVDARYGRVGRQQIEDTGPLTRKRMETIDDEVLEHASDFIDRKAADKTPFFVWFNTTHMHFRTHPKPKSVGQAGRWQSPYHDTMIDHDKVVGALLDQLETLGIADDTIVIYSTDNGPHMNTWPDGGMTPFRSEKNTNWEGAFRIPEMIRWPGHIPAGVVSNEIIQHHDWLPTFLSAAGEPRIVDKLKVGHTIGKTRYKVHIDGYDLLPYLTGKEKESPRKGLVYFSDDGDVLALRFDNWKVVFMEQRRQGTLKIWAEPFVALRVPKLFNLRTDPFERADMTSNTYYDWFMDNDYIALAGTTLVAQFLETFKEFPPRQKAASFTIDQVVAKLEAVLTTRVTETVSSQDRLPSWTTGATRSAIEGFVDRVTREGGADYVAPADRVAVFDNDGTLWTEQPLPIQADFLFRRIGAMAAADPSLTAHQPFKAVVEHDYGWLAGAMTKHYQGDDSDLHAMLGGIIGAYAGVTIEEFAQAVAEFMASAPHPTLGRPYRTCVYQPMLELLGYLSDRGFTSYIVSGGGRDFMRVVSDELYGIPADRVIGSTVALVYRDDGPTATLVHSTTPDLLADGETKPVAIWGRTGRRPILAAGNSNGDVAMLHFASHAERPSLQLLVRHDDAIREAAYVAGSEAALDRAAAEGWTVISVRDDWSTVFPDLLTTGGQRSP